jgi:hypothetical protein
MFYLVAARTLARGAQVKSFCLQNPLKQAANAVADGAEALKEKVDDAADNLGGGASDAKHEVSMHATSSSWSTLQHDM